MGKRNKRITRAMKIERAAEEARLEARYRANWWYPIRALTETDAVNQTFQKMLQRDALLEQIGWLRDDKLDDSREQELLGETNTWLNRYPCQRVANQAQAKLDARREALRRAEDYDADDYESDYNDNTDDLYEDPPLFDRPLGEQSVDELKALHERWMTRHDSLGDAERIDEHAVEMASLRCNALRCELDRRNV